MDSATVRAMQRERLLKARLTSETFLADAGAIGAATITVAILGASPGSTKVASVTGFANTRAVLGGAMLADGLVAIGASPLRNAAASTLSTA